MVGDQLVKPPRVGGAGGQPVGRRPPAAGLGARNERRDRGENRSATSWLVVDDEDRPATEHPGRVPFQLSTGARAPGDDPLRMATSWSNDSGRGVVLRLRRG